MTAPINQEFVSGTTITSQWLNGVNDSIINATQGIPSAIARNLPAKLSDTVSVKDFGAVGDGVTDDSAAIQAAINATFTNGDGGTLYIPTGDYLIGTTLNLNGFNATAPTNLPLLFTKRLRIVGAGSGSTRLLGGEIGYGFFEFIGANYLHFEGFTVYANRSSNYPQFGLLGGRATGNASSGNHTFVDVYVVGKFSKAGQFMLSSEINRFSDCVFYPQIGHGCVMAMNNRSWSMTPKYGTLGTDPVGGNGDNQFENVIFLSASDAVATDTLLALEYAQAFRLTSCYFASTNNTVHVYLRKSASGTLQNCFFETYGAFDPYSVYFAPDDSTDPTDAIDYRDIRIVGGRMLNVYGEDSVRITNMEVDGTVFRGMNTTYHINVGKLYDSRIKLSNMLANVTKNTNQKIKVRQEAYNNEFIGIATDNVEVPYPSLNQFRIPSDDQVAAAAAYETGCILTNTVNSYSGMVAQLNAGNVPGTAAFGLYLDFVVPNVTDTNIRMLVGLGGAATNLGGANTVSVYLYNGNLFFRSFGPTAEGENTYACLDTGFVSKFSGKRVRLLLVRDSSGVPVVYVNGYKVQIAQSYTAGGRLWTDTIAGNYLMVGFQSSSTTSNLATHYFASGLFNYALSAADARALTLFGLRPEQEWGTVFGGGTNGCIGYWEMESGGGTSIFDQSPFAQHATISGSPTRKQNGLRRVQYRTNAGTPSSVLTPAFIGEEVLNTSANQWFKAYGLTNTSWAQLN